MAGMTANRAALMSALALLGLAGAGAAMAQFKVVGPDGKVTYTDRPQAVPGAQVQPLRRDGSPAGPAAAVPATASLPAELRPVVARFPVMLYTSADCPPCEAGRKLLQQRGVPFSEHQVGSDDDIAALQRLTAGRTVPALTVGGQALRGFQEADWQGTLDLAGYPRESRLPRNYQAPAPTPLVARSAPAPAAAPAAPVEQAPAAAPAASGNIRF
jgi:glutaredoxin